MLLTGFPDLLSFNRQTRVTSDIKTRLETTSQEAVTGRRANINEAVRGDMGGALLLQKALDDIEQDTRINKISNARLGLIGTSLKAVREAVDGVSTQAIVSAASKDSYGLTATANTAEANLRNVFSLLNISQGDRKLFSGDATDTTPLAPVDTLLNDIRGIITGSATPTDINAALETYFNDPAGGFATNIYKGGDNNVAPSFLADGTKVQFDVRADDQAMRDTMRGLSLIALTRESGHATTSTEFTELFNEGAKFVNNGKGAIINIESKIGIPQNLIEQMTTNQASEKLVLGTALNGLIGRDQYEAATELKLLETQLESSYLITSRLANLTLTNYLR